MNFVSYLFFGIFCVVREEKNIKLHAFDGEGLHKLPVYCHDVYSPAMTFSEDGSLFAYCDGSM